MAKNLPIIRRLRREDIPGMPDWFVPALDIISKFFEAIYGLFEGLISVENNLDTQIFTGSFVYVTGSDPVVSVSPKRATTPIGVLQLSFSRDDGTAIPKATTQKWVFNNTSVNIYPTTDSLTNGIKYNYSYLIIYS